MNDDSAVTVLGTPDTPWATALRARYASCGLHMRWLPKGCALPGSYWGEREAGLVGSTLWVTADTPLHSALHEGCHWLCADEARRAGLHTDAGGDDLEECAVCYLSVLLADDLPGYGRAQLFVDMDAWGYSFRLGSAHAWFTLDADDARAWLATRGLLALAAIAP